MATSMNALQTSRDLEQAGFSKSQAEGLAMVFAENAASYRSDLVTKDFLKAELAELRGELRNEITGAKHEMIKWMLGSQAVLLAAVLMLTNLSRVLG